MITVLGKRVLVKPHERDKKTEGGILLPDQVEGFQTGTIIAIGDEVRRTWIPCRDEKFPTIGSLVHFIAGVGVKVPGDMLLLDEYQVLYAEEKE